MRMIDGGVYEYIFFVLGRVGQKKHRVSCVNRKIADEAKISDAYFWRERVEGKMRMVGEIRFLVADIESRFIR